MSSRESSFNSDIITEADRLREESKLKYRIFKPLMDKIISAFPKIPPVTIKHNTLYEKQTALSHFYKLEGIVKLRLYLKVLYKYLGEIEQCFFEGAFVIEDNDDKLLDILIQSSSVNLKYLSTHNKFNAEKFTKTMNTMDLTLEKYKKEITEDMKENPKEYLVNYTCDKVCESHLKRNDIDFTISCLVKGNKRKLYHSFNRENVLWYRFTRNGKKYVFLKTTQTKTSNLDYQIYGYMHRLGEKATIKYPIRSEDSKIDPSFGSIAIKEIIIDSKHLIENPHIGFYKKSDSHYNYIISSINNDIYGRLGNEFFIPELLNDFFIKYTVYNDNCTEENSMCTDNISICKKGTSVYIYDDDNNKIYRKSDDETDYQKEEINLTKNEDLGIDLDSTEADERIQILISLQAIADDNTDPKNQEEATELLELFRNCINTPELISRILGIINNGIKEQAENVVFEAPSVCYKVGKRWAGGKKSK